MNTLAISIISISSIIILSIICIYLIIPLFNNSKTIVPTSTRLPTSTRAPISTQMTSTHIPMSTLIPGISFNYGNTIVLKKWLYDSYLSSGITSYDYCNCSSSEPTEYSYWIIEKGNEFNQQGTDIRGNALQIPTPTIKLKNTKTGGYLNYFGLTQSPFSSSNTNWDSWIVQNAYNPSDNTVIPGSIVLQNTNGVGAYVLSTLNDDMTKVMAFAPNSGNRDYIWTPTIINT